MPVWTKSVETRHFWLWPQSIVTGATRDDVDFYWAFKTRNPHVFTSDPRGQVSFVSSFITQEIA